jgi:hypothetical protein
MIEELLAERGLIEHINGRYYQTDNNCFEIASFLARRHGFIPLSREELRQWIDWWKELKIWSPEMYKEKIAESDGWLIIREPDYIRNGFISDIHVTFQHGQKEFNFGPSDGDGFEISVRIPLSKYS